MLKCSTFILLTSAQHLSNICNHILPYFVLFWTVFFFFFFFLLLHLLLLLLFYYFLSFFFLGGVGVVSEKGSGLRCVLLPDTLETIAGGAFQDCVFLTSVQLPRKISALGVRAFQGCCRLEYIKLPDSILSVRVCALRFSFFLFPFYLILFSCCNFKMFGVGIFLRLC